MSSNRLIDLLAEWRGSEPSLDTQGLIAWHLENIQAGWLPPLLAERLLASKLFQLTPRGLLLRDDLGGPLGKSQALQALAETLREEGWIRAWRDEAHDWLDQWGRVRFSIERAAFRTLGLCSRAVHVNGYREDCQVWVAQRAASKAVDPDRLDNLAAGLIASGETPEDCLQRELQEEAGVGAELARLARPTGIIRSRRLEDDGVHEELLYCYDLLLPNDFQPQNQDGEVAAFRLLNPEQLAAALPEMTWDAGAVSAEWLGRWLDDEL